MDNETFEAKFGRCRTRLENLSERFEDKCKEKTALRNEKEALQDEIIKLKTAIADCYIEKLESDRNAKIWFSDCADLLTESNEQIKKLKQQLEDNGTQTRN